MTMQADEVRSGSCTGEEVELLVVFPQAAKFLHAWRMSSMRCGSFIYRLYFLGHIYR